MRLKDIPGVGEKLRDRLVAHYGDEEKALDALLRGDVAGLLTLRGMSERQAIHLVQRALGMKYGVGPGDFLATEEATRIYRALMDEMVSSAHTDYSRLKIGTLFPSSCPELIEENRSLAQRAMDSATSLKESGLDRFLSQIKPLRRPASSRVRNRSLAVDSAEALETLKRRGLDKEIDVHLVETPRELRDLACGYDRVTLLGEMDSIGLPEVEEAKTWDEWYLVPEAVLNLYLHNLTTLESALKAAQILERSGLQSFPDLEELERLLKLVEEGDDQESRRLDGLLDSLEGSVEEAAGWANDELRRKMETRSVTLAGEDLLQALGREGELRDVFAAQMSDIFQEVLKAARDRVESRLDLKGMERAHLEELLSTELRYPLDVDRNALLQFQQMLRRSLESRRLEVRREVARDLASRWQSVRGLVASLLEFDVVYSLGSFFLEKKLTMPQFVEDSCLGFLEGCNLFLEDPEPVSYSVGRTDFVENPQRVVLLSGVNSGGKTTLLELVAQVAILAHMGMPAPAASCQLSLFQELYFFAKSRGTLGAGAFESTIRKFSILVGESRKLILADELEAITEPGASAKIIASLLDEFSQSESVAVFVSHLAEEVQRFVETEVRIDGIESRGLDEDNNLIVDRNPVYNHLARSTPELIIDRLVRTTDPPEREFYSRLLKKFR